MGFCFLIAISSKLRQKTNKLPPGETVQARKTQEATDTGAQELRRKGWRSFETSPVIYMLGKQIGGCSFGLLSTMGGVLRGATTYPVSDP